MPDGKPAGVRCIHLTEDYLCGIFDHPDRPKVCGSLRAEKEMCGTTTREAFEFLSRLERATRV
jgi:hypothetical protein